MVRFLLAMNEAVGGFESGTGRRARSCTLAAHTLPRSSSMTIGALCTVDAAGSVNRGDTGAEQCSGTNACIVLWRSGRCAAAADRTSTKFDQRWILRKLLRTGNADLVTIVTSITSPPTTTTQPRKTRTKQQDQQHQPASHSSLVDSSNACPPRIHSIMIQ